MKVVYTPRDVINIKKSINLDANYTKLQKNNLKIKEKKNGIN